MATGEGAPSGMDTEATTTGVAPDATAETEAEQPEHRVGDQEIYETIKRLRVMSLGLGMAAVRTRDGLYTAWAYNATATAGILVSILEERNSPFLETLRDEAAGEEVNEGARQVL